MKAIIGNSKRAKRTIHRAATVTASVFLAVASLFPRPAISLENWQIEGDLNSRLDIEVASGGGEYLYTKPTFLLDGSEGQKTATAQLFLGLTQSHKDRLGEPTFIPIGVDSITIFVPHYRPGKQVGDAFVEKRLIRSQVTRQLSRQLIDVAMYGDTEQSQINALYANARQYLINSSKNFGEPLSDSDPISTDMVWPEFREIDGERVLVPILYLTEATRERQTVTDVAIEFSGEEVTFKSMSLRLADIRLRRNAFLRISEDLVINEASITADGDLNLSVGNIPEDPNSEVLEGVAKGTLAILSGRLTAQDNINIAASQMVAKTLVHAFKDEFGQGQRLGEIASIDSQNGDISIRSFGDILVSAGEITASSGAIKIDAVGEIRLLSERYGYSSYTESGEWQIHRSVIDVAQTKLTAEQSIDLLASKIELNAAEIVSHNGYINLLADNGIYVVNEFGETSVQKRDTVGNTTSSVSEFKTIAVRALLDAGKGVLLHSTDQDITLRAVEIRAEEGTQIEADNGKVQLLMAKELDHYQRNSTTENKWRVKTTEEGHENQIAVYPEIVGGLKVSALYGLEVEIVRPKAPRFSEEIPFDQILDSYIDNVSSMEGLTWMSDIRAQANWVDIELQMKSWRETNRNLTPEAMALVSVAVAVATSGAGAGLLGLSGGVTAATANAAFSSIVTQLSASLAAGNSLDTALKTLDDDDYLESLAISMVTAGALSKLGEFESFFPTGDDLSLLEQAQGVVVQSAVNSSITWAVEGGNFEGLRDGFTRGMLTNSISRLGQHAAGEISDAATLHDWDRAFEYLAHAGAGCIIGLATAEVDGTSDSNSCYSGAGGAVVGEFVGTLYEEEVVRRRKEYIEEWQGMLSAPASEGLTSAQVDAFYNDQPVLNFRNISDAKALGVDLSRLTAGLLAFSAGADVNIAASSAGTVAEYSALRHFNRTVQAISVIDDFVKWEPLAEFAVGLKDAMDNGASREDVATLIATLAHTEGYEYLRDLDVVDALRVLDALSLNMTNGYMLSSVFATARKQYDREGRVHLTDGQFNMDDVIYEVEASEHLTADARLAIVIELEALANLYPNSKPPIEAMYNAIYPHLNPTQQKLLDMGVGSALGFGDVIVDTGSDVFSAVTGSIDASQLALEATMYMVTGNPVYQESFDEVINIGATVQMILSDPSALGAQFVEHTRSELEALIAADDLEFYRTSTAIVLKGAIAVGTAVSAFKAIQGGIRGYLSRADTKDSEGNGSIDSADALSLRASWGEGLKADVEAHSAKLLDDGHLIAGDGALIAGGQLSRLTVAAKASSPELGKDFDSDVFYNIRPSEMKKHLQNNNSGVEFLSDDPSGKSYKIANENDYIRYIKSLYEDPVPNVGPREQELNPAMEQRIRELIRSNQTFNLDQNAPGLHAEVRAANQLLNNVDAAGLELPDKPQVATYSLTTQDAGQPKPACCNCGQILCGSDFEILTGR